MGTLRLGRARVARMPDTEKRKLGVPRSPCYAVSTKVTQNQALTEEDTMKNTRKQTQRRPNRGPSAVHEETVVVHRGRVQHAFAAGLESARQDAGGSADGAGLTSCRQALRFIRAAKGSG